ncbi:MAG: hypothetical protein AB7P69_25790 [Candidatus Binatia bacterium]
MEKERYDPYYRDFPSNVVPVRTPFTRPGRHDAGHVFFYVTNKRKRWSLLLDKTQANSIYEEARQYIPGGICQLWLVEKRYSTHKPRSRSLGNRERRTTFLAHREPSTQASHYTQSDQILVVLKEPIPSDRLQGDILSYHFRETDAIAAAETYTRQHARRAIVGLLLWDTIWIY